MAPIKRAARVKKTPKEANLVDCVFEMSVMIGLQGDDVDPSDITKIDCLLRKHCMVGVAALEKGRYQKPPSFSNGM